MDAKRKSWGLAFFIDALLAAIPTYDVAVHHGGWKVFVVYWIVLAVLRVVDNWSVRKEWSMSGRIVLKFTIVFVAEALALISAMEACDAFAKNCHRVFF